MAELPPPNVPEYQKPDAPGIWMNFDNSVSVYHVVRAQDSFEQAVQDLFALVKEAQQQFPDWPRQLFIDIENHLDEMGRFEDDFVELQQDFLFATLAHFVTALETPLTGPLLNPNPQRNDLPDRLVIGPPQ